MLAYDAATCVRDRLGLVQHVWADVGGVALFGLGLCLEGKEVLLDSDDGLYVGNLLFFLPKPWQFTNFELLRCSILKCIVLRQTAFTLVYG